MGREHLKTPDEYMAVEFARVMMLFGQALPTESDRAKFEELTAEASARGMNWVQALEYAAAHHRTRSVQETHIAQHMAKVA